MVKPRKKKMKTLSIVMPFHGRHELTRKTIYSILRHKEFQKNEIYIELIVVGKAPEIKSFCMENNVIFVQVANSPLGHKFNQGVLRGMEIGDYVMILGSDAFLLPEYLLLVAEAMNNNKEAFTADRIVFINAENLEGRMIAEDRIGSGYCVRTDILKKVFEKFGALYISSSEKSLDGPAFGRVKEIREGKEPFVLRGFYPLLLEVKTNQNLWPFSNYLKFPVYHWDELKHYIMRYDVGQIESFHKNYTYYKEQQNVQASNN